jgi:hypothetical protein
MIPGALNEDFLGEVSVRLTAPEAHASGQKQTCAAQKPMSACY